MNCALGLGQVSRLARVRADRARAAQLYDQALADIPGIVRPRLQEPDAEISWFVYVIRLESEFSRNDRDTLLHYLQSRNIGCNCYFTPIHLQSFYRDQFGFRPGQFPVTEHVAERTLALPFFNALTIQQVERVAATLSDGLATLRHRSMISVAGA